MGTVYITDHAIPVGGQVTKVRVITAADVNVKVAGNTAKVSLVKPAVRMMVVDELKLSKAMPLDDESDLDLEEGDVVIEVYVARSGDKNTLNYIEVDRDTGHIDLP